MTSSPGTSHSADTDIAANLAEVQARVAAAATAAGRDPDSVTLVAVGKTFAADRMLPVLSAGHMVFGENRVQEAEEKWPALRETYPDLRLHLIGPLQSNKARTAIELFDVIETVDRPKLAKALARLMDETGRTPDCFIQVNTGAEAQKAGVLPDAADAFIAECRDDLGLPVKGLMCIPPVDEEPSLHFQLLAEIAKRNGIANLSMGMSADFEIAVQFGATHVRVGSAIFGARTRPPA
jgi:pyridoxal phosphate enzyme (YggS family)